MSNERQTINTLFLLFSHFLSHKKTILENRVNAFSLVSDDLFFIGEHHNILTSGIWYDREKTL